MKSISITNKDLTSLNEDYPEAVFEDFEELASTKFGCECFYYALTGTIFVCFSFKSDIDKQYSFNVKENVVYVNDYDLDFFRGDIEIDFKEPLTYNSGTSEFTLRRFQKVSICERY